MKLRVTFEEQSTSFNIDNTNVNKKFNASVGEVKYIHDGQNGATFTPEVSEDGVLSWTNDRELPNPDPVNIMGKDGKDGYTPVKGVDYFDGVNGQNGKDGYTPRKGVDYFDGQNGKDGYTPIKGVDYFDGVNGKDGYTPIKGVDYFDGKDGLIGKDGADGYTPVRGTDYWTEADKAEIKSYVDEAILGGEW